jgi:hypothetical protein
MYFSQLYSPGKSSRIGWWRGNCKKAPPHHCRCLALTSMVRPIPLSAPGPKSIPRHRQPGGGGTYTATHILYSNLYCTLATACFRLRVLRPNVRFSRLNARNCLKMTKSTNFKAHFRCRLPLNQGEEAPASDRPRDLFAHFSPAGCKSSEAG